MVSPFTRCRASCRRHRPRPRKPNISTSGIFCSISFSVLSVGRACASQTESQRPQASSKTTISFSSAQRSVPSVYQDLRCVYRPADQDDASLANFQSHHWEHFIQPIFLRHLHRGGRARSHTFHCDRPYSHLLLLGSISRSEPQAGSCTSTRSPFSISAGNILNCGWMYGRGS